MAIDIQWDTLYKTLFSLIKRLSYNYGTYDTLADIRDSANQSDQAIAIQIEAIANITRMDAEALYQSACTLMRDGYMYNDGRYTPLLDERGELYETSCYRYFYETGNLITILEALRPCLHHAYARALRRINKGR